MKANFRISHQFVEFIPEYLVSNVLYVSIPYATAAHSCFCGCGRKVVTPISRQGWSVGFDGDSVSLHPSIGNYELPCRSHYFVRNNQVVWARRMSQEEIDADRRRDGLLPGARQLTPATHAPKRRSFFDWLFGKNHDR